jgi:hypothetical protein
MLPWQDTIALLLVLLAAAALAFRAWRLFFHRPRGCGGCGTCAGSAQQNEPAVTTISLLPPPAERIH